MKVLCIDANWDGKGRIPNPIIGEYYNVVNEEVEGSTVWYELAEFPPTPTRRDYERINQYESTGFAPTSDIDEKELVKEREVLSTV